MSTLSWTPRRQGDIYCAPACGSRCTWASFEQATKRASALADLLGEGWEPEVSENMGWHYRARRPHLTVHANYYQGKLSGYTAFLNRDPAGTGGHWTADAEDAREAVLKVIEEARREYENMRSLMELLEGKQP